MPNRSCQSQANSWRLILGPALCWIAALGISWASAQNRAVVPGPDASPANAEAKSHSGSQPAASKQAQRAREGSLLTDENGSFEFVGDRILFVPGGGRDSLRVLENLALERIVRELGDARDQRNWAVCGTLTEFKGANYLLVTKALLKTPSSPASPRPDRTPAAASPQQTGSPPTPR